MSTKPITISKREVVLKTSMKGDTRVAFGTDGDGYATSRETWDVLGQPDVVTLVVKPGDLVNVEPKPSDPNWKFVPTDPGCGLKTFIGEAVGAASMCWETPEGAGVFDSTRAQTIVEAIYERSNGPEGARLGMATTEQLLAELRARLQDDDATAFGLSLVCEAHDSLSPETLNYRTVDPS